VRENPLAYAAPPPEGKSGWFLLRIAEGGCDLYINGEQMPAQRGGAAWLTSNVPCVVRIEVDQNAGTVKFMVYMQ